jgi:hypothetical protein
MVTMIQITYLKRQKYFFSFCISALAILTITREITHRPRSISLLLKSSFVQLLIDGIYDNRKNTRSQKNNILHQVNLSVDYFPVECMCIPV